MSQFERFRSWLSDNFPAAVLLMVTGGFAMVVIELYLMHHFHHKQVIAIAATAVGMVAALIGLWAKGNARTLLAGVLLLVGCSGALGAFFHLAGEDEEREHREHRQGALHAPQWLASQTVAYAEEEEKDEAPRAREEATGSAMAEQAEAAGEQVSARGERASADRREEEEGDEEEGEEGEEKAPPLAPLSVTGLGLMGALSLIVRKNPEA